MKVFFDTNVYVSEALTGGRAERILKATLAARWRIYSSDYLLDELQRVLDEDLRLGQRLAVRARERAQRRSTLIRAPASRHEVPQDLNDSPILKAALAAGADYLVSNDRHLLALDPYEGLRVLSMAQYEEVLRSQALLSD